MPNLDTAIRCRRLRAGDLPAAHRLSQAVRWPHRQEDWQFMHHLGSGFVAEYEGEVVGTALCWNQGKHYASLGMVIVSPEVQRQGIGRVLLELALDEIGDRNALLNATAAGRPLYERLGFGTLGRVYQHQGTIARPAVVAPPAGECLRPLQANDRARLLELATAATGIHRPAILNALLQTARGIVIEGDGVLKGFALIRRFGKGHVIGPVVAPDPARARAMIGYGVGTCIGAFVRIDVPDAGALSPWLDEIGLARVDSVVTMLRGEAPVPTAGMQQFAIISQALG